jgi:hypothetical protein
MRPLGTDAPAPRCPCRCLPSCLPAQRRVTRRSEAPAIALILLCPPLLFRRFLAAGAEGLRRQGLRVLGGVEVVTVAGGHGLHLGSQGLVERLDLRPGCHEVRDARVLVGGGLRLDDGLDDLGRRGVKTAVTAADLFWELGQATHVAGRRILHAIPGDVHREGK